jgi:hypothetical protein
MKRLALALFLAAAVTACVTPPPAFTNAAPVTVQRSFTLDDARVWKQTIPVMGMNSDIEFMLARGAYRAELENAQGTLYRGPKHAVAWQIVGGYAVTSGGVWVPRDPAQKARLYFYMEGDEVRYRDRAALVVAMKTGAVTGLNSTEWAQLIPNVEIPLSGTSRAAMAQVGAQAADRAYQSRPAREPVQKPDRPALQWEINEPSLEALLRSQVR